VIEEQAEVSAAAVQSAAQSAFRAHPLRASCELPPIAVERTMVATYAPPAHPAGTAFLWQGLIFCVATDSGVLKLYDIRSYEKGPFDTFTVRAWSQTAFELLHLPGFCVWGLMYRRSRRTLCVSQQLSALTSCFTDLPA